MKHNTTILPSTTLDALRARKSVKAFDDVSHTISDRERNTILEAATLAPTSYNLQPFRVFWLDENDLQNCENFVYGQQQINAKGCALIASFQNYDVESWKETLQKIDTHTIRLMYQDELCENGLLDSEWAVRQSYIPATLMTMVANEHGIDSCIMEGINGRQESALASKFGKEFLNPDVCDDYRVHYIVMFGYTFKDGQNPEPKIRTNVAIV